jgi:hypothetical protein
MGLSGMFFSEAPDAVCFLAILQGPIFSVISVSSVAGAFSGLAPMHPPYARDHRRVKELHVC